MITTILFDLDGTLLPMDQEKMIHAYMSSLAGKMASHGYEPNRLISSIWKGTGAMVVNDGTRCNEDIFWDTFSRFYEKDCKADEEIFEGYYRVEFQEVRYSCGFNPLASDTIRILKDRGLRLVLATNPLFPSIATYSRLNWAGLNPSDFELITSYENSFHCKPNPDYYQDILDTIGVTAEECLMVGNDVTEDMVAKELGMEVFLLTDCIINKENKDISQYPHGSFPELMNYIRSL